MRQRLRRVAALAVTVLLAGFGAATLLGFLDGLGWFFQLGSFFRLQYAVALAVLAVGALLLRRIRHASAALALVGVNLAVVAPFWSPSPALGPVRGDTVRALVLNLEVGNDRTEDVSRLIREADPDVVGLSELSPEWAEQLEPVLASYPHRALAIEDSAYGIGLYSRVPIDAEVRRFPADGPPSVVGRLEIDGEPVTLVLTHVHTPFAGDIHVRQLEALAAARDSWGEHAAICGDFNTVPWSTPFRALVEDGGFSEAMRGGVVEYSWPTWSPLLAVPIDNCLLSDGLALESAEPGPDVGSDHFPLIVEIGLPATAEAIAAYPQLQRVPSRGRPDDPAGLPRG